LFQGWVEKWREKERKKEQEKGHGNEGALMQLVFMKAAT